MNEFTKVLQYYNHDRIFAIEVILTDVTEKYLIKLKDKLYNNERIARIEFNESKEYLIASIDLWKDRKREDSWQSTLLRAKKRSKTKSLTEDDINDYKSLQYSISISETRINELNECLEFFVEIEQSWFTKNPTPYTIDQIKELKGIELGRFIQTHLNKSDEDFKKLSPGSESRKLFNSGLFDQTDFTQNKLEKAIIALKDIL